jgi:hypothetical protein
VTRARVRRRTEQEEREGPSGESHEPSVLDLQRSAGNQAVGRLLRERRIQRSTLDPVMNLGEKGKDGGGEKRKREEDPSTPPPAAKKVKREEVGEYVKDTDTATFDRWMHTTEKWHFTYFKTSGDYHLKGNTASARAFQKGYFGGTFKTTTGNAHKKASAANISEGQAEYAFCLAQIVPQYSELPSYKGQHA